MPSTSVKFLSPSSANAHREISPTHIQQKQPTSGVQHNPWDFEYPWSQDLCTCKTHCDETCYAIWCYPCFSCQLAWRMNESCWVTCCVPGSLAILRTKIRTAFRIDGSYAADFCVAECCPCCATLQMAGELRHRKVMR
ncbi:unnamed protein product [Rotaria magnacalcarata]|uniref:Cornifelin n=1 Tax=Rotaria magnacalcarata TaxID=392030 RepID=A0A816WNQ5_9BILA|nr:unnamed protein product [Rotaria magnacalcarata]CAF1421518.1 unnamed protein product [Rotaria magnacalcarata]CAF1959908.1 unnamed protein product [Rotaria magnacalcarata]CAF2131806.1 unnamed protein product [Rotaria magnacalcarata]CAF2133197.1 unnamed protein product [Rotaria magnacalcarata]